MAEIEISFAGETRYLNDLLFDILEANSVHEGMKKEIPGGASLTLRPMEMKKGRGLPGNHNTRLECRGRGRKFAGRSVHLRQAPKTQEKGNQDHHKPTGNSHHSIRPR